MKLSEIIKAIDTNTVVDDAGDNKEVFLMVQRLSDDGKTEICGYINGDYSRLAAMIADRMVKHKDFHDMILAAAGMYVMYENMKQSKSEEF